MIDRLFSKKQHKHVFFFFMLLFLLAFILPIVYGDDASYAIGNGGSADTYPRGNIFSQQIFEYITWHGRFLTHLIGRIILQNRWTSDILAALMALFFLTMAWIMVYPDPKQKKLPYLLPIFWTALIIFFAMGIWIPMVQVIHFASYRLSFAFIALFLWGYLRFFRDSNYKPSYIWVGIWGIVAGSMHEQAVVITPALLMLAGLLKLRKEEVPQWYWLGCIAVIIGNCIVLGSPHGHSVERLIGYGRALEWDFFGQTLNWIELGNIRYFYSLIKILVIWIPLVLPWLAIFGIFAYKYLKVGLLTDRKLLIPLLLLVLGQAFTVVMMFSPLVENQVFTFGLDFTMAACFSLIAIYAETKGWGEDTGKKMLPYVYGVLLIPLFIQLPSCILYRQVHWKFVQKLKQADLLQQTEVTVEELPKFYISTPIGNIRFIYPPDLQRIALYQGYGHIKLNIIARDND